MIVQVWGAYNIDAKFMSLKRDVSGMGHNRRHLKDTVYVHYLSFVNFCSGTII